MRAIRLIPVLCAAGCGDAILLEIASDRPVPSAIDAICVGVADASPDGDQFGRAYRLEGALAQLPQTLRIEAGDATSAHAWVRGDRGGVPTVTASAAIDFGGDVTVALPRCQVGPASEPRASAPVGLANARLVATQGQGGVLVVAVTAGTAVVLDVRGGALTEIAMPAPPPGAPVSMLATDVDGDCDDDIVIATDGAPPVVWERVGSELFAAGPIGSQTVAAVAALDVERDGDFDLVVGGGASLQIFLNDGAGTFTLAPSAIAGDGRVSMISALATGDLDGDGHADIVVGQAGPPLAAWLGRGGRFEASDGVVAPLPLDAARLTLADADGDFDPDLGVAVRGAPMRLLVDRDGRLEDQSFVRLPQPAPSVAALAFGGWDAGCEPDAVLAGDGGTVALRGEPGGAFAADAALPAATDVLLADIDDDGDLDALLATPDGVVWLAR